MARNKNARFGTVWQFRTARFRVALILEQDYGYRYDGYDENGETQAKLDSGEYVAFDSKVIVELDGEEIAADYLGGSVYSDPRDFVTEHYGCRPKGYGAYFPDMVRQAISDARDHVEQMTIPPRMRGDV